VTQEIDYYELWKENPPRLPSGPYSVLCLSAKKQEVWRGRGQGAIQITMWMQVCDGEFSGITVPMFILVRKEWEQGTIPMRSAFYQAYFVANGMKKPERAREKDMSPKIFEGKVFKCWIRDSRAKFNDGRLKPDDLQYSLVEELTEPLPGLFPNFGTWDRPRGEGLKGDTLNLPGHSRDD